jgi:hypothetical protein
MKRCPVVLALAVSAALAVPAPAGILFGRKKKEEKPADRVSQLVAVLKSDPSAKKRTSAAEDLRQFDPRAFPQIVPVLVEALQNDADSSVRAEAAQSLGRLRPVTQEAGMALQQAVSKDGSWRVRMQARASLATYHLGSLRGSDATEPLARQPANAKEAEGPMLVPPMTQTTPAAPPATRRPNKAPVLIPQETPPPPLADPVPAIPVARPLPKGPPQPAPLPRLQPPPSRSDDLAPELGPPQ